MKIAKMLTSTLMASTLLLGGATACAGEPKVEQNNNTEAEDKQEIVETVDAFYAHIIKEDTVELFTLPSLNETRLSAKAKKIKWLTPETFVFFDAYDTQTITNAYWYSLNTMLSDMDKIYDYDPMGEKDITLVYSTLEEAVTVNGDTATVDKSKIAVSFIGEYHPPTDAAYEGYDPEIDMMWKDGKWLINAPTHDWETGEKYSTI